MAHMQPRTPSSPVSSLTLPILFLVVLVIACGGIGRNEAPDGTSSGDAGPGTRTSSGLVEGKDFVVLERVRLLDEMGFDRPVEAMSILVPRGWKTEGGVRWNNVNGCRGEIVTWDFKVSSPDGAIRFTLLPFRTFVYYEDQMMQQAAQTAAQQGGCAVSPPFTAEQYLENLARTQLDGATVVNTRNDESFQAVLDKINAQGNSVSQQYGTGLENSGSAVIGSLTWPDGTKGFAHIGVSVSMQRGTDYYGSPNGGATTMVLHQAVIRYPPDREEEARKFYGMVTTSHRMNPIWLQAKTQFLTNLGNIEHAGRMERLRLQGEQSRAYAKSQSDAADERMRDWERSQASSDANQHRFIQTIREVETWKDSNGSPVELSAGYQHGWSRPDGSYILTDNSLFDPALELQQPWTRMEKARE